MYKDRVLLAQNPEDLKLLKSISADTNIMYLKKNAIRPRLLEAMLFKTWIRGAGLTAVQIGIPVRYAVIQMEGIRIELLNPIVKEMKNKFIHKEEGCLSLPYYRRDMERFKEVYVIPRPEKSVEVMRFDDTIAVCIQHEVDHFDGKLIADAEVREAREKGVEDEKL